MNIRGTLTSICHHHLGNPDQVIRCPLIGNKSKKNFENQDRFQTRIFVTIDLTNKN